VYAETIAMPNGPIVRTTYALDRLAGIATIELIQRNVLSRILLKENVNVFIHLREFIQIVRWARKVVMLIAEYMGNVIKDNANARKDT